MNLGVNSDGNSWKYAVINFTIVFLSQLVFAAYDMLALGRFPSVFECWKALVTSAVATLGFYGINRVVHKEE